MIQKLVVPSLQTEHRMALAKLANAAFGCKRKVKCSAPPVQLPVAMELKPRSSSQCSQWRIIGSSWRMYTCQTLSKHMEVEFFSAHCHGFCRVPSRVMVHSWWLHQGAVVWIVLLHESERPEVQSLSSQVAVILTLHKSPAVGICCKGLLTTHLRTS